jgi:hypothetical protein
LGLFFVVCLFLDFASLVNSPHNPSAALFSVSQFNLGDDKSIWANRYWIASTCRSHLVKPSLKTEKNRGIRKLFSSALQAWKLAAQRLAMRSAVFKISELSILYIAKALCFVFIFSFLKTKPKV